MKYLYFFFLIFSIGLISASTQPKREFRAAWVASVTNLDWPQTFNNSAQRQALLTQLDNLKARGINAVIFQIRPECDALYQSAYEPWSYWLTGQQGLAPNPFYDPLELAVSEAHKRGIELHAWFNPYRAERSINNYSLDASHIYKEHPEWTFVKGSLRMLDPGIPAVQQYVTAVVMDVVNRYNIDGVHFDDYFYPYEAMTLADDQATWDAYHGSFSSRYDWRRNNVNTLIHMISDSILAVKPHIKFGISPFGIYKSGQPPTALGTTTCYDNLYCDPVLWLQNHWIDYITPQLYWAIGSESSQNYPDNTDYSKLLPWWAGKTSGRHLYPGQAAYRITSSNWPAAEVPNQIKINRSTSGVYGSVFFRSMSGIVDNPKGFADSLSRNYYRYPALPPALTWKDGLTPNPVINPRFEPLYPYGPLVLKWETPSQATDGDSAFMYAVYRFSDEALLPENLADPQYLIEVTGEKYFSPLTTDGGYFAVSALDRNFNESEVLTSVTLSAPQSPLLVSPVNGNSGQRDTLSLAWNYEPMVSDYEYQVAVDSQFTEITKTGAGLIDTSVTLTGLAGLTGYFWRVRATNPGGISDYSDVSRFTTAFPPVPGLSSPAHASLEIPVNTSIYWHPSDSAKSYQVQVSYQSSFLAQHIYLDTLVQDTALALTNLQSYKIYWWRVKALNSFGKSGWSAGWGFKTMDMSGLEPGVDIPGSAALAQNYPNPFNPVTTIKFTISQAGMADLRIYDISGKLMTALVNRQMFLPGTYKVTFDGSTYASGIYFYRLQTGQQVFSRKMILIR